MLSLEKLANANIKNRAEYTQLSTELNRLEKEKQNELRMFNNEIQRFKARYSKTNFGTDTTEASNVKMYETHNPGFCFKRNGEHRVQQNIENIPPVDFEHLHFLLFTDGEVDIEKVLCLHLLSSHETDHLTPPRRPRTSGTFMKKDSPLEQLIERSKHDIQKDATLRAVLPTYVIDQQQTNRRRSFLDERLSARLLVNEKILDLITTVITALEHSNPEKVRHLVSLAESPSKLKRIFCKQHIQDFVMTLKDHALVNSCSSFILTQPSKIKPNRLEIRTPSGALEDLVHFIRSNVLQFPKRESFNMLEGESREMVTMEHSPLPSKGSLRTLKRPSVTSKGETEKEVEMTPRTRRRSVNYIKKNIEEVPKYVRNSLDEVEPREQKRKKSSTDSTIKEDVKSKRRHSRKMSDASRRSENDVGAKRERSENEEIRVHSKQTTCPACMEKWRIPLPHPKVPKLVAKLSTTISNNSSLIINPIIRTNSKRRLTALIEQEEYKLNSYDRKYSNASTIFTHSKKRGSTGRTSTEWVPLSILDLEKIRHEIREKETQKKLEKFLGRD